MKLEDGALSKPVRNASTHPGCVLADKILYRVDVTHTNDRKCSSWHSQGLGPNGDVRRCRISRSHAVDHQDKDGDGDCNCNIVLQACMATLALVGFGRQISSTEILGMSTLDSPKYDFPVWQVGIPSNSGGNLVSWKVPWGLGRKRFCQKTPPKTTLRWKEPENPCSCCPGFPKNGSLKWLVRLTSSGICQKAERTQHAIPNYLRVHPPIYDISFSNGQACATDYGRGPWRYSKTQSIRFPRTVRNVWKVKDLFGARFSNVFRHLELKHALFKRRRMISVSYLWSSLKTGVRFEHHRGRYPKKSHFNPSTQFE